MKIILPVAGKGTRLRPHTHTRAKSLVQVAGKTVLEHIIERLKVLDAEELIFITDENGHQIESFMRRCFPDLHCSYIVQTDRLGPAHAVSLAAPRIAPVTTCWWCSTTPSSSPTLPASPNCAPIATA